MSSLREFHADVTRPAPTFSLAALADFVTVGTPAAVHQATAAFDDVIATADDIAALSDILRLYDGRADEDADHGPADHEPLDTPAAHATQPVPAFAPEPIPSREDFEAVADFWSISIDDLLPCYPTKADDIFYLGYQLESAGEPAILKDRDVPDPAIQLAFANGRRAAREERKSRIAREAKEAEARSLLAAYSAGQAAGYGCAEPIPPHGYNRAESAEYLKGYHAGADVRFRETMDDGLHLDPGPITDRDVYGGRTWGAIAEDEADRREWSFMA